MAKLQVAYPLARFHSVDAAIGGTGSQLAAFRLERDVLSAKPDLVFLDFTVNDDVYAAPDSNRLAAYEAIVRRLVEKGINVVQVILPTKVDVLPTPPPRPLDAKHKEIGAAYGLPLADAVAWVKQVVSTGSVMPDELWDVPSDNTHPGDMGYSLYAEAVWSAFQKAVAGEAACRLPDTMLHADSYMTANRYQLSKMNPLPNGWKTGLPNRNAVAFDFVCSRWMDNIVIADHTDAQPSGPIRLHVKCANALLFGEATKDSGDYSVQVNDSQPETVSTHCRDGNMWHTHLVASGLDPEQTHTITITPLISPRQQIRLDSLCLAGGPAKVLNR